MRQIFKSLTIFLVFLLGSLYGAPNSAPILSNNSVTIDVNGKKVKLTPKDPIDSTYFGYTVAISNGYAVVGRPFEKVGGTHGAGSVYVYDLSASDINASQIKLTPSSQSMYAYFGMSIGINKNYIVLGARGETAGGETAAGAVYLFDLNAVDINASQTRLILTNPGYYDHFGSSVSVTDTHLLVGARLDKSVAKYAGSAYLFDLTAADISATEEKLTANDFSAGDMFGHSVALSDNYAVVGAYADDLNGESDDNSTGSAYLFDLNAGNINASQIKLTSKDSSLKDDFATSVAISDDYILIGAITETVGFSSGATYLFDLSAGDINASQIKLTAAFESAAGNFGTSVALSDKYGVVGALGNNNYTGETYLFDLTAGDINSSQVKLVGDNISYQAYFGHSVSLSGDYAIVGAKNDAGGAYDGGSATIYDFSYQKTVPENTTAVTTFSGSDDDGDTLSFSISGEDSHLFTIDSSTGEITFKQAPDYENPIDKGKDNIYVVTVTVSDTNGGSDAGLLKVTVTNGNDAPTIINNSITLDLNGTQVKLTAFDGKGFEYFGQSVSVANGYAVVGVPYDDVGVTDSGSAYLFDLSATDINASQVKLTANDTGVEDYFGYSVSIADGYAIVGANGDDDGESNSGSVYLFDLNANDINASQVKLTAKDPAGADLFGRSVSIDNGYAVVGAFAKAGERGSAYLFDLSATDINASQVKLTASDASAIDQFGYSVSISNDYVVVGSVWNNSGGSAYLFELSATDINASQIKLTAKDSASSDKFGSSVAITDNYAVIGASQDNDGATKSGSAYLFDLSATDINASQVKLTAQDPTRDDEFGGSVSINEDYAVVGSNKGGRSAYLYNLSAEDINASQVKLNGYDIESGDRFGNWVSIASGYSVIGSFLDGDGGMFSGSAYLFDLNGTYKTSTIENFTTVTTFTGSDVDGDTLTYSISGTDSALFDIDSSSGAITFKTAPDFESPSDSGGDNVYDLLVTVTDTSSASSSSNLEVTVTDSNNEIAPTFSLENNTTNEDTLFSIDLSSYANDPEGNTSLVYSASIDDTTLASISLSDSTLKITPKENKTGVVNLEVNVTDGLYTTTKNITLTINSVNDAPIIGNNSITIDVNGTQVKLTAKDAAANDEFGYSVSIANGYAVFGSYKADSYTGTVHLFDLSATDINASQVKLTAKDAAAGDNFGNSVSIANGYAVVGANYDDDGGTNFFYNSGSAYLFDLSATDINASQVKLTAKDAAAGDIFGNSVSIANGYAVVGAYYDDDGGSYSGSAYLFDLSATDINASQVKLTAKDSALNDQFGYSVSIANGYAVVGAPYDDDDGDKSGSAYLFDLSATDINASQVKLTAKDPTASDEFGFSVSIANGYAVVGAHGDDDGESNSGSAYLFNLSATDINASQVKLTAKDPAASDEFGNSVSIANGYAVVGAYKDDDGENDSGSAYLFDLSATDINASQVKLTAKDPTASDEFGFSVSIEDTYAVVGAYKDDDGESNSGSAYLFNLNLYKTSIVENTTTVTTFIGSDVDGDTLTYSISGTDSALFDIDSSSGAITFKTAPDFESPSDSGANNVYDLVVTVTDTSSVSSSGNLEVTVTDSNNEIAPTFSLENNTTNEDTLFSIDLSSYANDPEGNTSLVYSASIDDTTLASISLSGSTLKVTPKKNQTGVVNLEVSVTDGLYTTTKNITLTINSVNDAPIIGNNSITLDINGSQVKLTAKDGGDDDEFGKSVSISNSYAVVGSYLGDDGKNDSGSAYLFDLNALDINASQIKLTAINSKDDANFGNSVAISDDYAIIGAFHEKLVEFLSGSVYLFDLNVADINASQIKLTAANPENADYFGSSVYISNRYAIVGANGDDGRRGSAYLFDLSTSDINASQIKLTALNATVNEEFGSSVSITDSYAAIVSSTGNVYLFDLSASDVNASQVKLTSASNSVSIANGYVIVGQKSSESAYIFDLSAANIIDSQVKLTAAVPFVFPPFYGKFGSSVSIVDDYAIVGADNDNLRGSAYIFDLSATDINASQIKLTSFDTGMSDYFGFSVSTTNSYAVVGAFYNNGVGNNSGSAYLFDLNATYKTSIVENTTTVTTFSGSDVDGDTLTFSISGTDSALFDIDSSSGAITFKTAPDFESPSDSGGDNVYEVVVTVTDTSSASSSANLEVTVMDSNNDLAPTFSLENNSTNEDTLFSIDLSDYANDPEGNSSLVYSASIDDTTLASISLSGSTLKVTPKENQTGVVNLEVNVTDGLFTTTKNITLTINSVNDAPIISNNSITLDVNGTQVKLTAKDADASDYFGVSSAIADNYAIVGAHGSNNGSAYLFDLSATDINASQVKLTAKDPVATDLFAYKVSIGNGYAVVASSRDDSMTGSVYLYDLSATDINASQVKLTAKDAITFEEFGSDVAIGNKYLIVGASGAKVNGLNNTGAAYLFDLTAGDINASQQKLIAKDAPNYSNLGSSVAISENYAVFGSYKANSYMGTVHLFDLNAADINASQVKIVASDVASGDNFGVSLALNDSYLLVGANGDDDGADRSGSAYLFDLTAGDISASAKKLTALDPATKTYFGKSVALSESYAVVGMDEEDTDLSGRAYVFNLNATDINASQAIINSSDWASGDSFGISVAVGSKYILVGSEFDDDGGSSSGSAYLFDLSYKISVVENTTTVTTFSGSDVDGDTLTYSISGIDSALFNIDSSSGVITFKAAPDFESPSDSGANNVYDLVVTVTDTGSASSSANLEVTVTDFVVENSIPTDITLSSNTIAENSSTNTIIGTLSATDADSGDTATFTLGCATAGVNDGNFTIDGVTLKSNYQFDYESVTSQSICIRVEDSSSGSYDEIFTISIADVNEDVPVVSTPEPEAPVDPETPTDPESETPVDLETPTDPKPETPVEPETPTDPIEVVDIIDDQGNFDEDPSDSDIDVVVIGEGGEEKKETINTKNTGVEVTVKEDEGDTTDGSKEFTLELTDTTTTNKVEKKISVKNENATSTTTDNGFEIKSSTSTEEDDVTTKIELNNNGTSVSSVVTKDKNTGVTKKAAISSFKADVDTSVEEDGSISVTSGDVQAKVNSDGSTEHKVKVNGKETKATSKANNTITSILEDGTVQTKATVNNSDGSKTTVSVDGKSDGQASHRIKFTNASGKEVVTKATSEIAGATTAVSEDGSVETSVKPSEDVSLKVAASSNGWAVHEVDLTKEDGTTVVTKATSKIPGAQTIIDSSGSITTTAKVIKTDGNGAQFEIRAIANTDINGETITRFERVNLSTGETEELDKTIVEETPFEEGNEVEIEELDDDLQITVGAKVTRDLVIE